MYLKAAGLPCNECPRLRRHPCTQGYHILAAALFAPALLLEPQLLAVALAIAAAAFIALEILRIGQVQLPCLPGITTVSSIAWQTCLRMAALPPQQSLPLSSQPAAEPGTEQLYSYPC